MNAVEKLNDFNQKLGRTQTVSMEKIENYIKEQNRIENHAMQYVSVLAKAEAFLNRFNQYRIK